RKKFSGGCPECIIARILDLAGDDLLVIFGFNFNLRFQKGQIPFTAVITLREFLPYHIKFNVIIDACDDGAHRKNRQRDAESLLTAYYAAKFTITYALHRHYIKWNDQQINGDVREKKTKGCETEITKQYYQSY